MKHQQGFGLISTIIVLAITAAFGWFVISRMTNLGPEESPNEAIDRAKTNVDKASEASSKVKDAVETTQEVLDEIDDN